MGRNLRYGRPFTGGDRVVNELGQEFTVRQCGQQYIGGPWMVEYYDAWVRADSVEHLVGPRSPEGGLGLSVSPRRTPEQPKVAIYR